MKNLITMIVLLFFVHTANAQSHVPKSEYARYNCKFAPKGSNNAEGKLTCPACAKENEDAKKKKAADDKTASEASKLKNEKLKAENAIAFKKKQAENAKTNKSTEVYIAMPKTAVIPTKKTTLPFKNTPAKPTKDVQFFADFGSSFSLNGNRRNYFLNENGDTILKSDEYYATFAAFSDNKHNFPKNIGIVLLKEQNQLSNGKMKYIADLVDIKGKRYFNDNTITTVSHLINDYFLVCRSKDFGEDSAWGYNYRRFQDAEIYNIKTKKRIPFEKDSRYVELYQAFDHKKLETEGLTPIILRRYANYDDDIYCLDTNGELVIKKFLSGR